jgi:hypothetical protein
MTMVNDRLSRSHGTWTMRWMTMNHGPGSLYETDNEGLYTNDPTNMDGQGDDLYFDNDWDVRMSVDPWGDDQEFPSNLDDGMFNFLFYFIFC